MEQNANLVRVIDSANSPEISLVKGKGKAIAVVSPATGAQYRTMHHVHIDKGSSTISLKHEQDAVYYIIDGSGHVLDESSGKAEAVAEGNMLHIDAGDAYRFIADQGGAMTIIGGPCPADISLYSQSKA